MTGVSIRLTVENDELTRWLYDFLERVDNKDATLKTIGSSLVASTSRRFDKEQGPDGRAWEPLSASTIRARTKRGRSAIAILRENGLLAGSISYEVGDDYVEVGSTHHLAPTHQLGATIAIPAREGTIYRKQGKNGQVGRRFVKRKKANHETKVSIPAYSITIPARPFLGISADDEFNIWEDVNDWLTR